ncbi:MAG: hypothetical protein JKY51_07995 [Opitutaceae bacterium]|nr:hypothetical protein [Opitutaceae bacterium]
MAETSLTIEGVELVVDSGLVRMARFDPKRGINALTIEKISMPLRSRDEDGRGELALVIVCGSGRQEIMN